MPVLNTWTAAQWHETSATVDSDAIHDNQSGEISAVAEKASPVAADLVLIEDSTDGDSKKRVQLGNLPLGSVDRHDDVDTVTVAPNVDDALKWDGSNWVPGTAAGAASFARTFALMGA